MPDDGGCSERIHGFWGAHADSASPGACREELDVGASPLRSISRSRATSLGADGGES